MFQIRSLSVYIHTTHLCLHALEYTAKSVPVTKESSFTWLNSVLFDCAVSLKWGREKGLQPPPPGCFPDLSVCSGCLCSLKVILSTNMKHTLSSKVFTVFNSAVQENFADTRTP